MRVHRAFDRVVGNGSWSAVHLATRTPVEQPSMLAEPTDFDGVAATRATLPIAAVDGKTGAMAIDRRGWPVQMHIEHLAGRGHDPFHVGLAEHRYRREWVLLARPEDLAAEHVADAPGNVLIEQCVGNRRIEVGVPAQGIDRGAEVRVADTEVGARRPETRVSVCVELPVRLDGASAETHGQEPVDGDAGTKLRRRFAPSLTRAIEVPRAGEAHAGVQHQPVVPHDVELPAAVLDELDDAASYRDGTLELGRLE